MLHAFRLGPLDVETESEGEVFMFAAAAPDGAILGPLIAGGDEEGLRRLRAEAPGESFVCEPALVDAAGTMGLPTAPMAQPILWERALLALDFAMWPVVDESNAPALLARILKSSLALAEAAPWEKWPVEAALEVAIEGAVEGTWEGSVFGPETGLPGFLLYRTPGTVARIAGLVEDDKMDEIDEVPCIGLLFADAPEYAKEALADVGVWFVPHVHHVTQAGSLGAITDADLHAVLAVAGALAHVEEGERQSAFELEGARVRVRVPDGVALRSFDEDVELGLTYDPDVAPDPDAWLAADEQLRMDACLQHHAQAGLDLDPDANPSLHATLHVVIENQIALCEPRGVGATVRRLVREGLSRHEALHAVSTAVLELMRRGKVFDEELYDKDLEALTAEGWLAEGNGDPKPRKN